MRYSFSICSLILFSLCFVMACEDDDGVVVAGDILVRVNNLTGEAMTDLQIGFFGYDNLQELGDGQLAVDEMSAYEAFMEGGSCDFNISFRDVSGQLQQSCTPCECICIIDSGNFQADVNYQGPSGGIVRVNLVEVQ